MQVTTRSQQRRYVTPTMKNKPSKSEALPKKTTETSAGKSNPPLTLKKLVDRFRHDEPQPRPERESISSDFWWLHEELKNTSQLKSEEDDDSNLPEFIEIFPSTDIDQDLNQRASLLLNQTFSAHSSDTGQISSTGIGSTMTSTFQPTLVEQPARPIFTRFASKDFRQETADEDILYQWRLRRRLEQAHNEEPVTFPIKVSSRPKVSPKKEEIVHIEPRHYSEASTQTLQDACIQTSFVLPAEVDLRPTRDCETSVSFSHRSKPTPDRSSPIKRPTLSIGSRSELFVASSQESALTEVTSIVLPEENDELLNILLGKRDELLRQFREIEQCLN